MKTSPATPELPDGWSTRIDAAGRQWWRGPSGIEENVPPGYVFPPDHHGYLVMAMVLEQPDRRAAA